jgi:hypothetical protein
MVYKDRYNNEPEYPSMFYDESFDYFILSLFKRYNSLNILLRRDDTTYDENGRFQNLQESKEIDDDIREQLLVNNIPFVEFNVCNNTAVDIFNYITSNKL